MLDGLTLGQLRMFVAIAEAGSFRKGAVQLRRAQSAVSHAIANLELQLGVALFDRSAHRPALTAAGQVLLEDARGVLLKVGVMRARARGMEQGVETQLSVFVDTLFPLPMVADAMRHLRERYPTVRLRVAVEPLGGPPAALREGRCDLAIMAGEYFFDPRIECERLLSIPVVAVAARSHALAERAMRRRAIAVADLAEYAQVVLEDPTTLSEGRDFGVMSPQTVRVATQEAKRALIVGGVGWGRLPRWSIEAELEQQRLLPLPTAAWGPEGEVATRSYLAHRLDQAMGPAAQCFRESLFCAVRESEPRMAAVGHRQKAGRAKKARPKPGKSTRGAPR